MKTLVNAVVLFFTLLREAKELEIECREKFKRI